MLFSSRSQSCNAMLLLCRINCSTIKSKSLLPLILSNTFTIQFKSLLNTLLKNSFILALTNSDMLQMSTLSMTFAQTFSNALDAIHSIGHLNQNSALHKNIFSSVKRSHESPFPVRSPDTMITKHSLFRILALS